MDNETKTSAGNEVEILQQKIKMLEEENARLRGLTDVSKINESIEPTPTPTRNMLAPTTQIMNREKENKQSNNNSCCVSDDKNRNNNRDCCWCCCGDCGCCEGGGDGCEGGCDDS